MPRKTSDRGSTAQPRPRGDDLAAKYRKIGITAVAAAVEYQGARKNADKRTEDSEPAASRDDAGAKPRGRTR